MQAGPGVRRAGPKAEPGADLYVVVALEVHRDLRRGEASPREAADGRLPHLLTASCHDKRCPRRHARTAAIRAERLGVRLALMWNPDELDCARVRGRDPGTTLTPHEMEFSSVLTIGLVQQRADYRTSSAAR
jgi:hypothetical protein